MMNTNERFELLIDGSTMLTIDTTSETGRVCLGSDCVTWPAQGNAEVVLEKVDTLLRKHRVPLDAITSLRVNSGPGSFTGTRIGVAVANGLAWALKKSINGLPIEKLVSPVYNRPPNITKKPRR